MSEKQKPADGAAEKVMTRYDKKLQKRKEEERKERQRKKAGRIIGAVIAVALVAFIAYFPVSRYVSTHSTYVSVGDSRLTRVEFDYYYNAGVNDYVAQYGSYLSYLGLDTSKDFSKQYYSDTLTWDDFFQQNAVNGIKKTKALLAEAEAAGFTHDATAEVDAHMENIKEAAKNADMTLNAYIRGYFGSYATLKNIRPFVEESYIASAYYAQVAESKAASDGEITAYYEENKDSYDSVDYKVTEVAADIPEGEETTDGEGNKTTAEPTEEQVAEAMKAAKAEADKKLETVDADGELKENIKKAAAPGVCRDWLFEAGRKAGDTTVVEDAANEKYYVLQFEKRYLDDTATVNVRVIMTTQDNGAAIVDEWNSTGAGEDAFAALVEKYSEDEYTNTKGGLYEDLQASGLNEDLRSWMMDGARKPGDVTSILSEDNYTYVLYYVSQGRLEWKASVAGTLLSQTMSDYLAEITGPLEVSDPNGRLTYIKALEEAESKAAKEKENQEGTDGLDGTKAGSPETEPVSANG